MLVLHLSLSLGHFVRVSYPADIGKAYNPVDNNKRRTYQGLVVILVCNSKY